MRPKNRQVLIVALVLVLVSSTVRAGIQVSRMGDFLLGAHPSMPDDAGVPSLSGVRVVSVGFRNQLLMDVLDAANKSGASLVHLPDIPDAMRAEFDPDGMIMIAVVFDGDWIQNKLGVSSFGEFLKTISSGGILLTAIGGHTSGLFDRLNESGIYVFGPGRNPASSDPACAAFRKSGQVDLTYVCSSFSAPEIARIFANSASDPQVSNTPVYMQGLGSANLTLVRSFHYTPLLASYPRGKLSVSVDIYKLLDDGMSTYDSYYFFVTLRSQAGHQVYGSDWLTADFDASHVVVEPISGTMQRTDGVGLHDYGPSTAYGVSDLDFTVGQVQRRYNICDVEILDQSDYSQNKVAWVHNIDEMGFKPFATYTYQAEPAFVVKTYQDRPVSVDASYHLDLGRVQWFLLWPYWEYYRIGGSMIYLDALRTGDS